MTVGPDAAAAAAFVAGVGPAAAHVDPALAAQHGASNPAGMLPGTQQFPTFQPQGGAPVQQQPMTIPAQGVPSDGPYFTAEQVEQFRQQEKAKVYPQMEQMRETIANLTAERDARLAEEAAAAAAAEEAARLQRESEMSASELIAQTRADLEAQIAQEREARMAAEAMLNAEAQWQELQAWRNARIEQERDNIMPELLDLITGDTPEEIEASILNIKERSDAIFEAANGANLASRQQLVGTRPTAPAAGPMEMQLGQRQYTAEEINNMPLSEYAKVRRSLIGGGADTGRGLFGQ